MQAAPEALQQEVTAMGQAVHIQGGEGRRPTAAAPAPGTPPARAEGG